MDNPYTVKDLSPTISMLALVGRITTLWEKGLISDREKRIVIMVVTACMQTEEPWKMDAGLALREVHNDSDH